ncbi:MAG: helix-turn-helix transcriptional regulator [Myxococcota bacterium]
MLDTHRWRGAGIAEAQPNEEPPVVVVDMEQAADRLKFIAKLSPTEREVAYWVLQGLRDAQIAQILGRAERTAKRHVGQVLAKAGVQNRTSLWNLLRTDGETKVRKGKDTEEDDDEGDHAVGSSGDSPRSGGVQPPAHP